MSVRAFLYFLFSIVSASAAKPEVLQEFGGNTYFVDMIEGRDGAVYALAGQRILRLTPSGACRVLYEFESYGAGSLVAAEDGHLYGTAEIDGTAALFRLSYAGRLEVIHRFEPSLSGPAWASGLVIGQDGALYGLTGLPNFEQTRVFCATLDGDVTTFADFANSPFLSGSGFVAGHNGEFMLVGRTRNMTPFGGYNTIARVLPDGSISAAVTNPYPLYDWVRIVPYPDGSYYVVSSRSLMKLSPAGALVTVANPYYAGMPLLARDGMLYGGRYSNLDTGLSEILQTAPDGSAAVVASRLRRPLMEPWVMIQAHNGDLYGRGLGAGSRSSAFRFRLPGQTPVNLGPLARPDYVQPPAPGMSKVIAVLNNDTDVNRDRLTITNISLPTHGTAALDPAGEKIIYTAPSGGSVAIDEFTYTIADGQGGRGMGRVTVRENVRGKFNALIADPNPDVDGRLTVQLGGYGAITGRLWLRGFTWRFSGTLDTSNRFAVTLENDAWQKADLNLQLLSGGKSSFIEATISSAGKTTETTLTEPALNKARAAAGVYTFVIPSKSAWRELDPVFSQVHGREIEHPLRRLQGHGIGFWRVRPNGSVIATGRLHDGRAFASGSWMDSDGRLQFFNPLYRMFNTWPTPMCGWLRGMVTFRDMPGTSDAAGQLQWNVVVRGVSYYVPPLAREEVSLFASRYTLPAANLATQFPGALQVQANGGGLSEPITGGARAVGNSVITVPPLHINGGLFPRIGQLRGQLGRPNSPHRTTWSGVIFPKQNTIFGQFLGFSPINSDTRSTGTGKLRIQPE